jgi:hypothetical protein
MIARGASPETNVEAALDEAIRGTAERLVMEKYLPGRIRAGASHRENAFF